MLQCRDRTEPTLTATIPTPSRRRIWTWTEYRKVGHRDLLWHEVIDGRHFATPSPGSRHAKVKLRLLYQFLHCVDRAGRGEVLSGPLAVHLGRGTIVLPDILVVSAGRRSLIGEWKVTGVPDLLVEILSPERLDYDCRLKFDRYERAGVPEFWIVDPDGDSIAQFVLRGGKYGEPGVSTKTIRSHSLRGVEIDLEQVW
jgi:Uma2 family endonuclease